MKSTRHRTLRWLRHAQQRALYQWRARKLRQPPWDLLDGELATSFSDPSFPDQERYSKLFSYLVFGLHYYGTPDRCHVYYPGASSCHAAAVDAMEGFCRILPMIAAWLSSGRPGGIPIHDGGQIDLLRLVKTGLLAGTDPDSRSFWGHISDYDQRIVEAADVALAVWLLRDALWPQLAPAERERICRWLAEATRAKTHDNNWHLSPVLVGRVLAALGYPTDGELSSRHYARVKSFYAGDGWFSDGPDGRFDYYNAWGIHYALFWINQVDALFDPAFLDAVLDDFARTYQYFFAPAGFPIMGRSICYRMAAPAPLIAAVARGAGDVSPGMARRALNCVWAYFIQKGAIRRGYITQGYWEEDLRLLDNYSGPGSSLWATRSLTVAFYHPANAAFWTAPLKALPVEEADYATPIPAIGWEVRGIKASHEVQIIKRGAADGPVQSANPSSRIRRFLAQPLGLPARQPNRLMRYERGTYSALDLAWLGGEGNTQYGTMHPRLGIDDIRSLR